MKIQLHSVDTFTFLSGMLPYGSFFCWIGIRTLICGEIVDNIVSYIAVEF